MARNLARTLARTIAPNHGAERPDADLVREEFRVPDDGRHNPLEEHCLADLRTRRSVKWRVHPPDVLPMWVAEMDVGLAPAIREVLTDAVACGDTGYAIGPDYARALAAFASARWDWSVEESHTRLVPDVMLGIVELLRVVTRPGEGVVVTPPVYPPFFGFIGHMQRLPVPVPLTDDARLDLPALEEAFAAPATTAFLLCSPHNPTGTVHTADELRAVARLADRYDVRVVADEIHAPLVLAGARFVPYLALPEAARGFALHSASKAWNLAGVKAALAVAGADARADLARVPDEVGHGVSHLGVLAHTAAFSGGSDWLDDLLAGLDANRALLTDLLAASLPAVGYRPGAATYLAWLDFGGVGLGDDPADTLVECGRVALTSGSGFGDGGRGHARLNFATSQAILREGVARIAACS